MTECQNDSDLIQHSILVQFLAVFPAVKLPGRDADHSPPSGAEVKNDGTIFLFPPPCDFTAWTNLLYLAPYLSSILGQIKINR
jgi:hypothetical protein